MEIFQLTELFPPFVKRIIHGLTYIIKHKFVEYFTRRKRNGVRDFLGFGDRFCSINHSQLRNNCSILNAHFKMDWFILIDV